MTFKKWAVSFLALLLAALALLGSVTVVIDPFFHYHAPLPGLQYRIFYQRYQNDGIVKHFDYDAVITGNSLCENFRSSEMDALFGTNAVKVPFSGASSKELDLNNRTAIKYNPDIRMIVMGLDYDSFATDKDAMSYDASDYPSFLYDSNPFNDVKYLFNKSIFKYSLDVLSYTRSGQTTTSFDDYSFWDTPDEASYGQSVILRSYDRPEIADAELQFDGAALERLRGNISQNILETAQANPQIEFSLFIPPFSMYYWDKQQRMGQLDFRFDAEREVIKMLLGCGNIRLFSFTDEFDLVQDYDRYKDYIHYDSGVNSWMLRCMAAGEHELTWDNYEDYLSRVHDFYSGYDYDALFPEQ